MISQNQIEPKHLHFHSNKASFSPYLAEILEIKGSSARNRGNATCFYSQKHNMIIVCSQVGTVQFYDATTLLPHKSRETLWISETITKIDFWPETDVYLMGCQEEAIYAYNASDKTLKRLRNEINKMVLSVAFINAQYYAFSLSGSKQIHVGSLQQEDEFLRCSSQNSDSECLYNLPKRKVLLSSLINGSMILYRTDQLPKLPIIDSIKTQQGERKPVIIIDSGRICNRELIITYGSNGKIRIWTFRKGRMRLVRVINIERIIHSGVYLEDYKMLAITCPGTIKFVSLITGRLEATQHLGMEAEKIFLMRDKNTIGVVDQQENRVKMMKLG